jgi:hypothetical protein
LFGAQTSSPVPPAVRAALDRMHPGWRIAAVTDDVRQTVGARLGPTPNVVVGDFDGNGRPDVAILVEYRNVDDPAKAYTHYTEIIAFLYTDRGYEQVRVDDRQAGPNPEYYLTLQKRGEQGFDFVANQRFAYARDSIGAWHFEKAGGTYLYGKGKFRYVLEAD